MKILIGTTNSSKLGEYERFLSKAGHETVRLSDLNLDDVDETGATFEENALLKARYYAKASGLITLSDDSGLEIDALGGAPGVYSKRWAGEDATWLDLADAVIEKMQGLEGACRTARLTVVVALVAPDGTEITAKAWTSGHIASTFDKDTVKDGYPYRALFTVENIGKLYNDLTEEEHLAVNHRFKALNEVFRKFSGNDTSQSNTG